MNAVANSSLHGTPASNLEVADSAQTIDRTYDVVRPIALGGMGCVLAARHRVTGRLVAIKVVRPELLERADVAGRVHDEAIALGRVVHPGIVDVVAAGTCPTHGPYVATELLEGRALDGLMAARESLDVPQVVWMMSRVASALRSVHRAGMVHRDVKPGNIFLATTSRGTTFKLVDFGIARRIETPIDSRITEPGELLGTLDYMPPEQLAAASMVDPRSDQYALGVVLFECLTGTVPKLGSRLIGAPREVDVLAMRKDAPPALAEAIQRMLAVEPEERFADMAAALAAMPDAPAESPAPVAQNGVSRRRFVRAPYTAPCRVVRKNGNPIDGRIEDISKGGLLVVLKAASSSAELPQFDASGEEVSVRFALPTSGLVVAQRASVRWVKDARGRAAIGVEFVELAPETEKAIDAYVSYMAPSVNATA